MLPIPCACMTLCIHDCTYYGPLWGEKGERRKQPDVHPNEKQSVGYVNLINRKAGEAQSCSGDSHVGGQ